MKRTVLALSFIAFFSIGLWSCLEEIENIDKIGGSSFQPTIEFPLINSDFTVRDFLVEGNSKARIVEQGGLMVLIYDDSLTTPEADQFFEIPDQNSPTLSINGGEFALPPSSSVTVSKNLTFNFSPGQTEILDSIWIKAGSLQLAIQSSFQAIVDVSVQIPSLHSPIGVAFQRSFNFTTPSTTNPVIDLSQFVIDLTNNGTATNTLSFAISMTITSTGQPITSTQNLTCSFGLNNLEFRALFGDLGTRTFPIAADSMDVDIFDNADGEGTFQLLSPSVKLTMHNSFGLPVLFGIDKFSSYKTNAPTIDLTGAAVSAPLNPYTVTAPGYSQIGQSTTSQILISSANSNLSSLISSLPNYLGYELSLGLNPGRTSTRNFVLDTSRITIGVHLELPFHGTVSGMSLTREYEFDGLGIDDIDQSSIKIRTTNGSPVDVAVQVYFVSDDGTVLDSLFTDPNILEAAPVNANGFATGSSEFTTEIQLTKAKVDRVEDAVKLVVSANMMTTNNGTTPVKFSADDAFEIVIGVKTKMDYKLE
jgi:hypothetical protein